MPKFEIDEISAADTDGFWERFVLPRKPVVIRGIYADQPIAEAATLDGARRLLGTMPVLVQDEYTRQIDYTRKEFVETKEKAPDPVLGSLAEYLDDYGAQEKSRKVVTEWDLPTDLLQSFTLPEFCRPTTPHHSLYLHSFIAGPQNWAHLHFDMDQRHVLLAQVFGSKGVALFPPSSSPWLHPFGNFGSISLQVMDPEERREFIELAGGAYAVIHPTDAIYIPPLLWHYLDYLDLGASFNVRFGRNPYSKFLSVENFLADQYLQAVAEPFAGIAPGAQPDAAQLEVLDEVIEAFNGDYDSRHDKYRAMRQVFRDIHKRQGLTPELPLFLFSLDDETDYYDQMRLNNNFLYRPGVRTSLEAITTPEPPATPAQLASLDKAVAGKGYPGPLLEKVLFNKFGRTSLADLNREEASRLLAFLRSPSGSVPAVATTPQGA
ncbi:cupin-like domain-containing protein [Streptomyces sp. NRRL S-646]|uniref:cupin-like domain-containing protein n=1 Tax=Streptomyces sp. NRRL S-646 TaxID=1463917 RepID=UPI0004CB2A5D|nr:cupin-like domain-containing protein [Streptomyces sp. NRRL S-646]